MGWGWRSKYRTSSYSGDFEFIFVCFKCILVLLARHSSGELCCPVTAFIYVSCNFWTVHVRVLKFHIWIPHRKIADPYFCSSPSYAPFWSYAPFKNEIEILLARYLKNYLSLGLDIWCIDWGCGVDYLINIWTDFDRVYCPLIFSAYLPC